MRQLADSIQNGGCKCDVFSQAFARFEASLPPSAPVDREERKPSIIGTSNEPQSFHEMREYAKELEELWAYQRRQSDAWRGIASAMGYEPKAHNDVRPTDPWILARVEKYRAALATPSVLAESTSNDCLLVAEAVRERCAGLCDSNAAQEREGMAELTTQRDRLAAENAAHMAEMIGAEIRSLDLSGVGVG